jgi:quinol monooxygenase YgiN
MVAAAAMLRGIEDFAFGQNQEKRMYGLIGKMIAKDGKLEELLAVMLSESAEMPGCLSYVIARDPLDENGLWITEVWDSKASHAGSLALPSVKRMIAAAKPLIAGFSNRTETIPVGGQGLKR